jgi:hypothetical protein
VRQIVSLNVAAVFGSTLVAVAVAVLFLGGR